MMKTPAGRRRGFTLIELMVTIAIIALALTLAAPSFVQFRRNSELTAATNTLLAAINTAKAEAMKTGRSAYVVPTPPNTSWGNGWVVFVDSNSNGIYDASSDRLVLQQGAVASYLEINGNSTAAGAEPHIKFDGAGYSILAGSNSLSFNINRTDTNNDSRTIVVARTGRVRTCNPATDTTTTCPSKTQLNDMVTE